MVLEPRRAVPVRMAPHQERLRQGPAAGPALRLAALFAVDAFAGGLAVQAVLALWLQQRYGASTTELGLLFFATNLLSALSQALAPAIAGRRGLLQTMLVPHFVSNLLLLAVPVSPSFAVTAVLLSVRHSLSKIDVPARQAFTAAVDHARATHGGRQPDDGRAQRRGVGEPPDV